jgi:hypothetical protein
MRLYGRMWLDDSKISQGKGVGLGLGAEGKGQEKALGVRREDLWENVAG